MKQKRIEKGKCPYTVTDIYRCPNNKLCCIKEEASIFRIKQDLWGVYIRPDTQSLPRLEVSSTVDSYNNMKFEMVDEESGLGYILHIESDLVVHPYSGSQAVNDGTELVLHADREPWALFSYDAENGHIKHQASGKYAHLASGEKFPSDGTKMVLWADTHAGTEFTFEPVTEK